MPMPTTTTLSGAAAATMRSSSLQRSNSIPYARHLGDAATLSSTSLANPTPAAPLPQASNISTAPRRPKTPAPISLSGNAAPKRPAVLRKRGATIHVAARPVTPALQTKNLNINTTSTASSNATAALGAGVAEDPIKAARRTELLRAVASQVEEIEKVTDAIAAARRSSVEQARQRLRENVAMEPPSPVVEAERQRTLRENAEKANAERERQKAIRLEQDRIFKEEQERRRIQEHRDAAYAEELRQKEIEQERRRIEEETRRIQEELLARQSQNTQPRTPPVDNRGRQAQQSQQDRPRAYFSRSRQRTNTREGSGERIEMVSDSDSDIFDAEWERFAEFFKLGSSMGTSKANNAKFKYQSPSTVFKEAWESYESRWSQLSSAQHTGGHLTSSSPPRLGFTDIPWPILHQPTRASDLCSQLTETNISSFILSPLHSTASTPAASTSPSNNESRARKLKIREALLRWHPDKMARILNMVCDEERAVVKDGAEAVARHLNALLSRE
ncbi:hypothetical protein FRC17_010916 [Serendipita sp. 399]|nr:hypothetical protein FRC17_010916 [Serendipita sp. 399]